MAENHVKGQIDREYTKGSLATPRWRRELRLLRRDGVRGYLHGAWLLRRFHRSVRRAQKAEGYDY